jgi:ankyrin repeat protein
MLTSTPHSTNISLLLKNGSNVNVGDYRGATPLHLAANVGKGESTKCGEILVEWGVDVNMKDDSKRTPLHVASLRGNITLIEKLLKVPSILAEEQDEVRISGTFSNFSISVMWPLREAT